ncbi:MAG: tetratricopeptide repeat protein [Candidatus Omnitrophica bacterium]|nr:tetratricopeptide repeat protein [Candidatus Omnitrophota bacterium]
MSHNEAYKHYARGNELKNYDREDEALEEFKIAFELNPNLVQAKHAIDEIIQTKERRHMQRAQHLTTEGRENEAVKEYEQVLQWNPQSWKAHKNLSTLYYKIGNLSKAMIEIKKAIALAPDLCGLHLTLAKYCDVRDNFEQALLEYAKALAVNPKDNLIIKQKNATKKVITMLNDPETFKDPFKLVDLGNIFMSKEMPEKAVEYYHKAHDLARRNQEILYSLANAYQALKNFDKAVQYFNAALKISPATVPLDDLYYKLGLCYVGQNNHRDAYFAFKECVHLSPEGKSAARAEANLEILTNYLNNPPKPR